MVGVVQLAKEQRKAERKALRDEKHTMCSGVRPLGPGWLGSALFLPESSDCTRSRSPLMAAAESVLCCRLRSSLLKA